MRIIKNVPSVAQYILGVLNHPDKPSLVVSAIHLRLTEKKLGTSVDLVVEALEGRRTVN